MRGATIKSLTETSLVSLGQVSLGWFNFFSIKSISLNCVVQFSNGTVTS